MSECSKCPTNCCGRLPTVRPVLMPWEENGNYLTEKDGPLTLLAKGPDGWCIYFDQDKQEKGDGGCSIYNRRPLECCLYPLILDFSKLVPSLKKDPRAPCDVETWPDEWIVYYRLAGH
jgi:Fe-S-cluster containining protein